MALPSSSDAILTLTRGYQQEQTRQAALVAALAAYYFRAKVDISSPSSVEAWLRLLIPKIIQQHGKAAALAVQYGAALRRLEVPGVNDGFRFQTTDPLSEEKVRTSLMVTGVKGLESKMTFIRGLDEQQYDPITKQAMFEDAVRQAADAVAGSTARHIQDGGRQTIYENSQRDSLAKGWVRVTDGDPCFFCAALASRGVVYGQDSFDESDARFTGRGHVKVHDSCGCGLKPVYKPKGDPFVDASEKYQQMWAEWSQGSGKTAMLNFRRGYEGRAHLIGT